MDANPFAAAAGKGKGGKGAAGQRKKARLAGAKSTTAKFAKQRQSATTRTQESALGDSVASESGGVAPSAKTRGTNKTQKTPKEKLAEYEEKLSLKRILPAQDERVVGRALWQAGSTLAAWKKAPTTKSAPETVLLNSCVATAKRGLQLTAVPIQKLDPRKRKAIVLDFSNAGVEFPKECQASLLTLEVKEARVDSEAACSSALDLLFPLQGSGHFNAQRPRTSESALTDEQKSVLLQTSLCQIFVQLLQGGSSKAHLALFVATDVLARTAKEEVTGMLNMAFDELRGICKCVVALLHPDTGAFDSSIKDVDVIMTSQHGAKRIFREARSPMLSHLHTP